MLDSATNRLYSSPFFQFLSKEWPECANKLDNIQLECSDYVLYVIWIIDTLRDTTHRNDFIIDPWNKTRFAIRTNLHKKGFRNGKEDIDLLTDSVCSHSLYCWGLVLSNDANDSDTNREVYMTFIHDLGEHWKGVGKMMNDIQCPNLPELRQWMISYVNSDKYHTVSDDIDWDVEATGLLTIIPPEVQKHPVSVNISIGTFNNMPGATYNDNSGQIQQVDDKTKILR